MDHSNPGEKNGHEFIKDGDIPSADQWLTVPWITKKVGVGFLPFGSSCRVCGN
jgi:hypothetical protein